MMVMNKDVIYIEPEHDITDILTGIKESQAKIVALVPPKKATVLKSAVNFKLLARTAKDSGKAVVLVTTDSALLKLAGGAGVLVAANLQSKPAVPSSDVVSIVVSEPEGDVIDGEEATAIARNEKKVAEEKATVEPADLADEEEKEEEKEEGDKKKSKKKKPAVPSFDKYRKFIIMGVAGLILIVGGLVWALAIAPSAKILVAVRTTSRPFSEAISFTTDEKKQDPEAGLFLLEEHKVVKQSEVEFEATGEVDKGDKATGTLTLTRTAISPTGAIEVPAGTKFTRGTLTFVSTEKTTLRALTESDCNGTIFTGCISLKPTITAEVKVAAEGAGTNYNMAAAASGWVSAASGFSIIGSEMTGGTSKIVRVVSAADVARAKSALDSVSTTEGRAELMEDFPSGLMAIVASFKTETGDPTASPAIGQEVGEGVVPKLVAKTTFKMFGVDRTRIHEYIEGRTKQAITGESDQMIYSTGVSENADENKAFIESFREVSGKFTGRLKSVTKVGPEVTDQMVVEKSLGRKIGEVQSLLKSINGISKVQVETSFFWVSSVPDDINKVSVEITVE